MRCLAALVALALIPGAWSLSLPTTVTTRREFGAACAGAAAAGFLTPRGASASADAKAALRAQIEARKAAEVAADSTATLLARARADLEEVVTVLGTNQDWVAIRRLLAAKPGVGDLRAYSRVQASESPAKAGAIAMAKKTVLDAIFVVDKKAYERQMEEITKYEVRQWPCVYVH